MSGGFKSQEAEEHDSFEGLRFFGNLVYLGIKAFLVLSLAIFNI